METVSTPPADEPHCRVGRIRFHAGGAEIRVIDERSMRSPESERMRDAIVQKAEFFAEHWADIAGFVVFVWGSAGQWSNSYWVGSNSPFASVMVPTLVAEGLRHDMATNSAVDWINRQMRGAPPPSG